ncbi:MAG: MerR family transcriptional regulator [Actinobacteria bacterium]|jgi:MerR family transcriptional regulator/heat shock protein HspR|nr:MerR family transcriptional regulator [Actinomycetota bacterium]NBP53742.1 MerR family transcriptional regulator [Actinomycetota bacterium]
MAEKRSRQETVYVISVAAELAGMHPQTLRIYERRGLVNPGRTTGGNRRYTDADIARLRRIAQLAAEGLNLEGIRMVMQLEDEVTELRRQVAELRARMNGETARGEIVPLRQAVVVFGQRPSIFDRDRY